MARKSFVFLTMGLVIFILCSISSADVPGMINYQGKLTTSGGALVNDTVEMTFSIYPDTTGSLADWTETQAQVEVKDGIFNVLLGSVVSIPASVFGGSIKYLGVKVGTDPEMTPLKPMVSVPYAYRAGTADGGGGGGGWVDDGTVVRLETSTDYVGIGTTTPAEKLDVSGNMKASGTITSGNSINIDGVNDKITASSGTISFDNENIATTGKATIGPGHTNTGTDAFVAGYGSDVTGDYSTVGGGFSNTASILAATVGGGGENTSSGGYSTVGGGHGNTASQSNATVAGGKENSASNGYSFVGGGLADTASGYASTIAGGGGNSAVGFFATVGGGVLNEAGDWFSTVAGGDTNTASGTSSTVAGGSKNAAIGSYSTIPGGRLNNADGDYSFAAGRRAKANHDGAFVWADTTVADFASTGNNQFLVRASGGVGIGTTSPQGALDVNSTTGAFIVPRMTTTQRDALTAVNGMIIYNTTTNQFNFYENGAWVTK